MWQPPCVLTQGVQDGGMHDTQHPLRRYRDEHNLTQKALGERLGVTGATILRWENGERLPRRGQWALIILKTGIEPGEFIPHLKTGVTS